MRPPPSLLRPTTALAIAAPASISEASANLQPRTLEQSEMDRESKISTEAQCRFCSEPLRHTFVDLGMSPLCESFLAAGQLNQMEPFYPLHVKVCEKCYLVQLEEYVNPENIFTEYAYFSSFSDSWLQHASNYVEMISSRLNLGAQQLVVELASNDGYLLQYFVQKGIPALGVEPAINVAKAAEERGVPTLVKFFGSQTAREMVANGQAADLVIGNNVLAQVPDLNDFVRGIRILLKPESVATLEFPHVVRLMEENQYDTIYHEHFSYFSLITVERIFAEHGLIVFDVDQIPTHGGSIRIYLRHKEDSSKAVSKAVVALRSREIAGVLIAWRRTRALRSRCKNRSARCSNCLLGCVDRASELRVMGLRGKPIRC